MALVNAGSVLQNRGAKNILLPRSELLTKAQVLKFKITKKPLR
jgi:hypothetical protein